jgi:hypothetical protein
MRTRSYTYRGPVGAAARRRGREHHELVVRDGAPGGAPACELDGRPVSRGARSRKPGASARTSGTWTVPMRAVPRS